VTHRGLRRRLSAYLEGELAPGTRRRAEAHLAGCAPCRAELAAMQRTLSLLRAQRGATQEAPDLLPQIARRLAAGEGAAPRSWLLRVLPRPGFGGRGLRSWGPPLAACAAALVLLFATDSVEIRVRLPWPAGQSAPQAVAEIPSPATAPAEPDRAAPSFAAAPPTAPANRPAAPGRPEAAPRTPVQSLAEAAEQAQQGARPFSPPPLLPQGPVRAASQGPARAQPVALGQPQQPSAPPAVLRVLRCAGQARGIGCLRLRDQWVKLALSDPRAFTARLAEIPDPAQTRWLAELSRFAVRRGTALQVISRLRGAGDPRAERLAARFEQSAANSTP